MRQDEIIRKLVQLEQSNYKGIDIKEVYEYYFRFGSEAYLKGLEDYVIKEFKERRKQKIQQLNELESRKIISG